MPRHQSRTSPDSTANTKSTSSPGLLQMAASPKSQLLNKDREVKTRQAVLRDLVGLITVGPPDVFPIKPATGQALFGLAVDQLAKHDKTTAGTHLGALHSLLSKKHRNLSWYRLVVIGVLRP